MIVKVFIIAVLAAILVSLASGLVFLIQDKGQGTRTVRALTWRIGLSVSLFALLVLGYFMGIIKPHGIYPVAPPQAQEQKGP